MEVSPKQPSAGRNPVSVDWPKLLLVFAFPLFFSVLFALIFEPLQRHQAEEYLELARQSSATPSSLFRPPGYVAFLRFINSLGGELTDDWLAPVYIGQGIVLGLASVAWYITACRWMTALNAWLMALAFWCNPLAVVLVGYIHYDILHLGAAALVGLLLVMAFANGTANIRWAIPAGIACGAMTLVRPMTLAEPAILALALGMQAGMAKQRSTWLAWAAFSFAMAATIAPRTWENYARTGRFIPVNAQTMAALWPMFEEPIRPNSDNFPWRPLWFRRGLPLLEKHSGAAALDPAYVPTHPLVLEDALDSRIRELVHTRPGTYLPNLAHNILFFLTGDSRAMIRAFVSYQHNTAQALPLALVIGFFIMLSAFLHTFGALGLALGIWRRDPAIMMLAALFVCLWIVHSMLYLDYRYIYIKLPFAVWFSGYSLNEYFKCAGASEKLVTWSFSIFTLSSLIGTALLVS